MAKIFFGTKFIKGAIHNIMSDKKKIGHDGEEIACEYLSKHNFDILKRNYFWRFGEIDIIALDKSNRDIVFLEVKTRKNFFCGRPSEFVDLKKQVKIKKTALDFIVEKNIRDKNFRFDVIEVINKKVWHIINAFDF